ncbi:LssY C-terminal domain-containing protein [Microterricola viridarii]|uniref:LssY C-terminus n=1 Tax=Microterricola viridarii TaxID=412690 RepID=A0A1H1LP94_9MICO|nr:LssY C-terminal domain-containing protein [Microterricola viridarii]SDR75689.1 LssY C-terminus [Microterricola viridarii]
MPATATQHTRPTRTKRRSLSAALDNFFFVFGGLAAVWLAVLLASDSLEWGWGAIWFALAFWLLLAYLVLPRLHRILTQLYVPNYFIGRARTSDGLLGDPVNLALLGDSEQLEQTMDAAGWTRADQVTGASSWRIITSTLTRQSYDEAPVSPLFLFGRQQDFAYQQEVEGNPSKRHHVRFWRCPEGWMLPGGHRVDWLAAGTFDRAVGFSLFTLQVTHKIDANTDIERDHIVATVREAEPKARFVVIRDFSTGYHARNGGGDSIHTDGDLPVIDLRRVALAEGEGEGATEGAGADAGEAAGDEPRTTELRGLS